MNYIIRKDKPTRELAQYYHVSLFSPTIATLTKLITRGNLVTWTNRWDKF